jgi:hypothetical protein
MRSWPPEVFEKSFDVLTVVEMAREGVINTMSIG